MYAVGYSLFTLKKLFKFQFVLSPYLSSTANNKVYGVCYNSAGHSHEYVVEVITRGMIDNAIGTVMSVSDLKWHLRKVVVHKLNGKNLNTDVDFFRSAVSLIKKKFTKVMNRQSCCRYMLNLYRK